MRSYITILLLLLALLVCGHIRSLAWPVQFTDSEAHRLFNGKIGDLTGDGQVATINSECHGFSTGPTDDGKRFAGFDLSPYNASSEFHLYFVFPELTAGQIIVTNTESGIVDVWLFRSDNNYSNEVFVVRHDAAQLVGRGGQKLMGRVSIRWKNDADFVIGADLACATNRSIWAHGEFVGSTKTKLNPIIWEWPAILLKGESK